MGGKKKPTLSQLAKKAEREKQQQQQAQRGRREARKEEAQAKRTIQALDEKVFQTIAKEVRGMKAVTPYEVASRYGIKVSIAYKVLRSLRDRGDLVLVSKGHRTELYIPKG